MAGRLMARGRLTATLVVLLAATLSFAGLAAPAAASDGPLERYAADTWRSFDAMTDPGSGLPADSLAADGTRSVQTSTTNIGAYMWSTLVARELGIVDRRSTVDRLSRTIGSLERMERHPGSGQYFNWYDHRTGEKLTTWPPTGQPHTPILSSVDNGWLAVGLRLVERKVPELSRRAGDLFDSMDFGFYYRPDVNRILFHYVPSTGQAACCYDTVVSESRIASYIGIAKGEIPARHTSAPGAASPTAATGPGRRRGRSACRSATSASTSSRAPTRTSARASRRRGAGACSRR
jgi:hypothetical protein